MAINSLSNLLSNLLGNSLGKWTGILSGMGLALLIVGCTSPYKAHELDDDDDFKAKGQTSEGTLGLNDKDEIEIKSETSAEHELKVQEQVNTSFEDQVKSEGFALHDCRQQLASPALGGNGTAADDSDVSLEKLRPKVDSRDDFGVDKQGDLKYVHKEYYADRLEAERKYEKSLRSALATIRQRTQTCQASVDAVRARTGAAPAQAVAPPPPNPDAGASGASGI